MISAKRNKESIITVSGLEVTKYYYFDFAQNGNALIVSQAENRFTIPIEDEKESTSRVFIPNVSDFKITYVPSEKKELIKKTLQAVCYLSDEVLEMTVNSIVDILSRES